MTEPVSVSPSMVASQSSVIGIGTTMFIFHEMVLPLTVPPAMSIEPRLPISEPLKVSPSGTTVRVPLWSPIGLLTTVL